jgi:hypothetical protein
MLGMAELVLITTSLHLDKDLSLAIQIGEKAIQRMSVSKQCQSVASLHMLEEVIENLKIVNRLLGFDDEVKDINSIEYD